MNIQKFKHLAAVVATSPLALLAEEAGGSTTGGTTVNVEGASDLVSGVTTAAQESLLGMLDTVAPVIATVIVAGLAIWGGIALVGVIKRSFNAGKGR